MCFTISESVWKKLTPEQQKIVSEAAEFSAAFDRQENRRQTEQLLYELEKEGMIINEPDLEPFAEATNSVLQEQAAAYGDLLDRLENWE